MTQTSTKGRAGRDATPGIRDLWKSAEQLNADFPGRGEYVPWEAVVIRDDLLPRERIDEEAVARYTDLLDELPPIEVQKDTLVLIDGRHRLRAASESRDHVRIIELELADDELLVRAIQANTQHGLPLRLSERVAAAQRLIRLKPQWSDAKIAEACGVHRRTIGEYRRKVQSADQVGRNAIPDSPPPAMPTPFEERGVAGGPAEREGKDGKVYPVRARVTSPAQRKHRAQSFGWIEGLAEALSTSASEAAEQVDDEQLDAALAQARDLARQAERFAAWADQYVTALEVRERSQSAAVGYRN